MGLNKFRIAGAVLSDIPVPEVDGNFSMLECDIIIVPKKIHKEAKSTNISHGRIDQAMLWGYQNEDEWKHHIKL